VTCGVIGDEGEEVSDEEEEEGESGGRERSGGGIESRVRLEVARGERKERSEYRCRDLSKAFSDLKNRIADLRLSTWTHQLLPIYLGGDERTAYLLGQLRRLQASSRSVNPLSKAR
jgi:hypothetical protein